MITYCDRIWCSWSERCAANCLRRFAEEHKRERAALIARGGAKQLSMADLRGGPKCPGFVEASGREGSGDA